MAWEWQLAEVKAEQTKRGEDGGGQAITNPLPEWY